MSAIIMDAIGKLYQNFFDWAGGLAPIHFTFLLRALLLFSLPCVLCAWALASGNRTTPLQVLCAAVGTLLTAIMPVDKLTITSRQARGWLLLCGVVALAFLPGIFATLVVSTVGMQRKVRIFAYLALFVLFLANLFLAWRQQ